MIPLSNEHGVRMCEWMGEWVNAKANSKVLVKEFIIEVTVYQKATEKKTGNLFP